ncbi:hypothetical protein [Kiloniella antarctica]|uniref:DNA translocase FtsK 4TM region domain-containing protein n=1 Tax=Kiloniella antarctica TaxID=1550907 RepID=A0ABW5BLN7_9PROT
MPQSATLKHRLILGLFSAVLGLTGMVLFSHLYYFIVLYGDGHHDRYFVVLNPESLIIPLIGYFFAGILILPRFFHSRIYKPGRVMIAVILFFAFFLLAFNSFIFQPDPLPYEVLGYGLADPLSELGLGFLAPILPEASSPYFGFTLFILFTAVSAPVYGLLSWALHKWIFNQKRSDI